MSEVASLDLCKELYELSEWEATDNSYMKYSLNENPSLVPIPFNDTGAKLLSGSEEWHIPAYSLGYLLRKLEQGWVGKTKSGLFYATYKFKPGSGTSSIRQAGKSPEDALCRLFIELFKSGVLTKGKD